MKHTEDVPMRTYNFPERTPTVPGPWEGEPDKAQWVDPATGLDCLIVRNHHGALCGYVGVPPSHPWHGIDDAACTQSECVGDYCTHSPGSLTEVHGGLTYSSLCQEGAEDGPGICHIPEPGRPAEVWWFGFDCAHAWDLSPRIDYSYINLPGGHRSTYRTFEYVQNECADLAAQLADVRVLLPEDASG